MASGFKGNQALAQLKRDLALMPVTMAYDVAQQVAPLITLLSQQAYDSGMTVYGDARPVGVKGQPLTLVKSGKTRSTVRFEVNGTIVRCSLPTPYAKYLIGKYSILPNGKLPVEWQHQIDLVVAAQWRKASEKVTQVAA